jgi:hypothetical protein
VRIINYEDARVTALFPLEEMMPLGPTDGRDNLNQIKTRYEFLKVTDLTTTSREEIEKNGIRMEGGRFSFEGQTVVIGSLAIFLDGIVVTANRTEYGEAMIHDLLEFSQDRLGFRKPITAPRFLFLSQIVVEFEIRLANLISKYSAISDLITRELVPIYQNKEPVNFCRVDFELEKKAIPSGITAPRFVIERRANIPFERERYFCGAPLRTAAHLRVLEEIEKLLG